MQQNIKQLKLLCCVLQVMTNALLWQLGMIDLSMKSGVHIIVNAVQGDRRVSLRPLSTP